MPWSSPANELDPSERAQILKVANSDQFVDQVSIQIYANLLDGGTYLVVISRIYRVLAQNRQLKEHRRLARHAARVIPELVAIGSGQVRSGLLVGYREAPLDEHGPVFRLLSDR